MKVRDVMSKNVVTVRPDTSFREIGDIIFGKHSQHKFSSVPVVDKDGRLLGIVTEKDLLRRLYPSQAELIEDFFNASNFTVMETSIYEVAKMPAEKIMGKKPVTVTPDTLLMKAGSLMLSHNKRRLPVVDDKGKLAGVISQGDIFRTIFGKLKKPHR